jgi:hypothetical protein
MPNEPCPRPWKSEQSAEGHGPVVQRIDRRRLAPRAAWQAQIDHAEKRPCRSISGVPGRHPVCFVWYAVLPRGLGG